MAGARGMKRAAIFTEAEIRRAIRAARAEGFDRVEIVEPKTGLKIVCERAAHVETPAAPAPAVDSKHPWDD
jgi:hypothetical protein